MVEEAAIQRASQTYLIATNCQINQLPTQLFFAVVNVSAYSATMVTPSMAAGWLMGWLKRTLIDGSVTISLFTTRASCPPAPVSSWLAPCAIFVIVSVTMCIVICVMVRVNECCCHVSSCGMDRLVTMSFFTTRASPLPALLPSLVSWFEGPCVSSCVLSCGSSCVSWYEASCVYRVGCLRRHRLPWSMLIASIVCIIV